MERSKYYLGKYFFALYDREDFFFDYADNINELMRRFGIEVNRYTQNKMQARIYHALRRENSRIEINGLKLGIYLIPVEEEE